MARAPLPDVLYIHDGATMRSEVNKRNGGGPMVYKMKHTQNGYCRFCKRNEIMGTRDNEKASTPDDPRYLAK